MGETTFPTGELITGFQPINSSGEHPESSCQPDQETMYLAAFCRENQAGFLNLPSTNLTRDFSDFYTRILPFAKTTGPWEVPNLPWETIFSRWLATR